MRIFFGMDADSFDDDDDVEYGNDWDLEGIDVGDNITASGSSQICYEVAFHKFPFRN